MGNKFRESKEKVVEEGLEAPREEAVVEDVTTEATAAETKKPRHSGRGDKAARGIGRVLGGDLLADKLVLRQIPLLLLCLFYLLITIVITYSYYRVFVGRFLGYFSSFFQPTQRSPYIAFR